MAAVWFRLFLKIVMLIVFSMSIVVIIVSSVTIVGVAKASSHILSPNSTELDPSSNSTEVVGNDEISKLETTEVHWKEKFLPKFTEIKREYKKVLLASLASTIGACILQMLASLFTLLSCSKDVRGKLKYNLVIHLVVFLILMICLAAPLVFDSKKGHTLEFHEIKTKFEVNFYRFQEKNFTENIMHELNAFFVTVGLNEGILVVTMIILSLCICCKCGNYNYNQLS